MDHDGLALAMGVGMRTVSLLKLGLLVVLASGCSRADRHARAPGTWKAVVRDERGHVLASTEFDVRG
jgi:hypothetical protein